MPDNEKSVNVSGQEPPDELAAQLDLLIADVTAFRVVKPLRPAPMIRMNYLTLQRRLFSRQSPVIMPMPYMSTTRKMKTSC